ncbi:PREDICTED: uncharacterized protein LOC108558233 [Nicrophorus vespilloides]|uniref:Uncharacterized protein LOC108558233 n=1 Tax=Nicrophorus vespilloides TaxID=110193 RepID=A0ABM1M7L9_NICVS|nr:PREDICTED: uncharacterized protein LOC108558233 [Nicrophorus vespilloides]
MASVKLCILFALVAAAVASPAVVDSLEQARAMCSDDEPLACLKYRAMSFLDNILKQDNYKLSEDVEITRNGRSNEITSRGSSSLEESVENYIQSHDVTFNLPIVGSSVTLGARNLDNDEVDLKMKFSGVEEARKSKLKKIFIPILVFVLLKAITLIPLAIGVLGLKAWNALQLSFFSFIVSVSLAVFQLCKKIAADNAHPQIAAHNPWEAQYAARSIDDAAQDMAYNAYRQ